MTTMYARMTLLVAALGLTGCLEFGAVEQGRVVAFDAEKKVCTVIRDTGTTAGKPDYSRLPPLTFALPDDAREMGAEPAQGPLVQVDASSQALMLFDPGASALKSIHYEPVSLKEGVGSKDPLVYDRAEKKALPSPKLDRDAGTLTIYLKSEKQLLTVKLPPDALALPDETWKMGDEVRIYYKQPDKAQRFMNVSRTDIYSK